MGASIGREAAPKLLGGASASILAGRGGLSAQQRRLLVACAGGAGLAAVYNVPLAGALFTAEILIGSIALPVMLPAIACSWIATAAAWIYLPNHATYTGIPDYRSTGSLMTWSLLAGPVIGPISAGYIRLIGWVSHHRARGTRALFAPGRSLRHPRHHRYLVPATVRERPGHGPGRVPRHRQPQPATRPVRAQAARHRNVPGQQRIRRAFHPGTQHRRSPRRRTRHRLESGLARFPVRRVRHGRRRGHDRRGDAGAAIRPCPGARAHPQRLRAHGAHDGGHSSPPWSPSTSTGTPSTPPGSRRTPRTARLPRPPTGGRSRPSQRKQINRPASQAPASPRRISGCHHRHGVHLRCGRSWLPFGDDPRARPWARDAACWASGGPRRWLARGWPAQAGGVSAVAEGLPRSGAARLVALLFWTFGSSGRRRRGTGWTVATRADRDSASWSGTGWRGYQGSWKGARWLTCSGVRTCVS